MPESFKPSAKAELGAYLQTDACLTEKWPWKKCAFVKILFTGEFENSTKSAENACLFGFVSDWAFRCRQWRCVGHTMDEGHETGSCIGVRGAVPGRVTHMNDVVGICIMRHG